jgi:hypothetical protein
VASPPATADTGATISTATRNGGARFLLTLIVFSFRVIG